MDPGVLKKLCISAVAPDAWPLTLTLCCDFFKGYKVANDLKYGDEL